MFRAEVWTGRVRPPKTFESFPELWFRCFKSQVAIQISFLDISVLNFRFKKLGDIIILKLVISLFFAVPPFLTGCFYFCSNHFCTKALWEKKAQFDKRHFFPKNNYVYLKIERNSKKKKLAFNRFYPRTTLNSQRPDYFAYSVKDWSQRPATFCFDSL